MSRIRSDIEKFMTTPVNGSGGELMSNFRFPEEFVGFQGHFPSKKVLPGACQIQCVLSMLRTNLCREILLKEIMVAKYFAPILPDENVLCSVRGVELSGEFIVKAVITRDDSRVTELKLRVAA